MTRRVLQVLLGTILATVASASCFAAIKASDNASNSAYAANPGDGAWQGLNPSGDENPPGNDNGGTGFLPWDFGGGYHAIDGPYAQFNHFIDGVDFPASAVNNLGGPAWGLANAGAPYAYTTTVAKRPFATPLVVGDTFSVDIDTPSKLTDYFDYLGSPGYGYPFAIISFGDSNGMETFALETGYSILYGDFNWRYTNSSNQKVNFGNIAPLATSDGSSLKLKMTGPTQALVTLDGVSQTIDLNHGAPASVIFTLFFNDAGSGTVAPDGTILTATPTGEHEFFFDNLLIEDSVSTPIPGDFDHNNSVNHADVVQWQGDFGLNGDSDADGDGDSDGNDLLIWQRHLGDSQAIPAIGAVPEPTTLALLIGAAGMIAVIGKRRS
jgi:hypothetical protein